MHTQASPAWTQAPKAAATTTGAVNEAGLQPSLQPKPGQGVSLEEEAWL